MGLYTTICFTPKDRSWTAPRGFIRELASKLEVHTFDHFSIYRRQPFWRLPFVDVSNRDIRITSSRDVEIETGISNQRVGSGYWTHSMFPFGDFMKRLTQSITDQIPEEIYGRFCPWDTSISNGHWETFEYETGKRNGYGRFLLAMSADECPPDLEEYLDHFSRCPEIRELLGFLSDSSGEGWTTSINLT